jgi:hypothetical protein
MRAYRFLLFFGITNTFEAPRWAEGIEGVERIGPLTRDVVALYVTYAPIGPSSQPSWMHGCSPKSSAARWASCVRGSCQRSPPSAGF